MGVAQSEDSGSRGVHLRYSEKRNEGVKNDARYLEALVTTICGHEVTISEVGSTNVSR